MSTAMAEGGIRDSQAPIDNNLRKKRNDLRDFVIQTIEKDREESANIAIIGPSGVGKSSVINTLIASMTGNYREYCQVGMHADATQKTVLTQQIMSKSYTRNPRQEERRVLLPNFIDIAGFEDDQSELTEELLRIVFYGRLPDRKALKELQKFGTDHGLIPLRKAYEKHVGVKVDRIIFVASACEIIPSKLIACVVKASKPMIGSADYGKDITLFGVMTMKDLMEEEENSTRMQRKIQEFRKCLGISGERFALIQNYTDPDLLKLRHEQERSLANLDIPSLNIIREVCDSVHDVLCAAEPSVPPYEDIPDEAMAQPTSKATTIQPRYRSFRVIEEVLWLTVKAFILALFVHFLVLPIINYKLLNSACAMYEQQVNEASDFNSNITISTNEHLQELCDQKSSYAAKNKTVVWYSCAVGAAADLIIIIVRAAWQYYYYRKTFSPNSHKKI